MVWKIVGYCGFFVVRSYQADVARVEIFLQKRMVTFLEFSFRSRRFSSKRRSLISKLDVEVRLTRHSNDVAAFAVAVDRRLVECLSVLFYHKETIVFQKCSMLSSRDTIETGSELDVEVPEVVSG